ncbi:hypothetical protein FRC11_010615, partial [Ceratobasidium sp. 423]
MINRHLAWLAAAVDRSDSDSDSDESSTSSGTDCVGDIGEEEGNNGFAAKFKLHLGPDPIQVEQEFPPLEPVPVCRNLQVTIEDWADPDDDYASSYAGSDLSEDDEEVPHGPDQDPAFVERGGEPLGAHPEDEPLMDDGMLCAFLDMRLGNYAEDEWFNL